MTEGSPPAKQGNTRAVAPALSAAGEAVRAACLRAALDGYERAGLSGLCEEGRWEMVIDSLRSLDVEAVLRVFEETATADRSAPSAP